MKSGGPETHRQGVAAIVPPPFVLLSISTSYFILRNGIAAIALAFPAALLVGVGPEHVQPSLSAYYHYSPTHPLDYGAGPMRDVFVGALCTIGAFLLFYRGCTIREDLALNVAGVAAVLIAFFPMDWPAKGGVMSVSAMLHFTSAAVFFIMIGYVCVFRARDTLVVHGAVRRRRFGLLYLMLGILMIAVPCTIYALHLLTPGPQDSHLTLLIELAGVAVFATFWLVKSYEILLFDRENRIVGKGCRCGQPLPPDAGSA